MTVTPLVAFRTFTWDWVGLTVGWLASVRVARWRGWGRTPIVHAGRSGAR
jgi:hypothetical protein